MDNNQLNRNILKIGMWIFSFFFWYLVVAFFLKSNYPIYEQPFNRKEAYEALRDALTLSAYFLAPAVAFILFSDWREQHKIINNEKVSVEIKETCSQIYPLLSKRAPSLQNFDEYHKVQMKFISLLLKLKSNLEKIYICNDEVKEYVSDLKNALKALDVIAQEREIETHYHFYIENENKLKNPRKNLLMKYFEKQNEANSKLDSNSEEFNKFFQKLKILYI